MTEVRPRYVLARTLHGIVLVAAVVGLSLELVRALTSDDVGTRLVRLFSYFTIQSNILAAIAAGMLLWRPDRRGRVMYHERVRDALLRHIEKDLGPVALPQIPASPQPFTVAEYFPTPGVTPYHDPRQHAVSLAYVVPVLGDCRPQQDAIDLAWMTPEEACAEQIQFEMNGGQGLLLRQAMGHVGRLP